MKYYICNILYRKRFMEFSFSIILRKKPKGVTRNISLSLSLSLSLPCNSTWQTPLEPFHRALFERKTSKSWKSVCVLIYENNLLLQGFLRIIRSTFQSRYLCTEIKFVTFFKMAPLVFVLILVHQWKSLVFLLIKCHCHKCPKFIIY